MRQKEDLTEHLIVSGKLIGQILCTRHLIQNTENKLADKCGSEKKARREIINQLFGKDGLANADDSISFEVRSEVRKSKIMSLKTFQILYTI